MSDLALDKGLPVNLDAERFCLGALLIDHSLYPQVAGLISPEDMALEKHRRILHAMSELHDRGEKIDRITVANELLKHGQLESCDGLSYLVSLDDGMPRTSNVEGYARIVRDKSLLRKTIFASQKTIDRCLTAEDDPRDIIASSAEGLLKLEDGAAVDGELLSLADTIQQSEGGLNAFLDPSKRAQGIQTGFVRFDDMTGGLRAGELIILAARPGMGKTALCMNIARNVAVNKPREPVAVFSLEMSRDALFTRMLCAEARVDSQKFRAGFLSRDERTRLAIAANTLAQAPIFIDDRSSIGLAGIHTKAARLKAEKGLGLVIVDYLQLMTTRERKQHENRNQEISALSRGLKLLSKELGVPMLVLSQLSRAPEARTGDHRPQLQDLRESGSIEQDADLVAFIFREELYKPEREDLRGTAELILAKQRQGPTGKINLVFLRQWTKFENRAADLEEEAPPMMEDSE